MDGSILNSTKKACGVDSTYTAFDSDFLLFINGIFGTLNELGIGPSQGFMIEDESALWSDFLGESLRYNAVKTYLYLRVRLLFDPPSTSYVLESLSKQITELEWRLNVIRESTDWAQPSRDYDPDVIDAGILG